MKEWIKTRYARGAAVAAVLVAPVVSFAQSTPATDVNTAITQAQTEISGYVATWGGAFIAICLLVVGWRVGGKLVKRLGSAG
jgi:hypothetical protein